MPVPQEHSFFVEQASCLFLRTVQDVSFNRMQALRQGFKPLPGSGTSQKLDRAFIHNRAAPTHQAISQYKIQNYCQ